MRLLTVKGVRYSLISGHLRIVKHIGAKLLSKRNYYLL